MEQVNRPDNPKEIETFTVEREDCVIVYNAEVRGYETEIIYKEEAENEFYK